MNTILLHIVTDIRVHHLLSLFLAPYPLSSSLGSFSDPFVYQKVVRPHLHGFVMIQRTWHWHFGVWFINSIFGLPRTPLSLVLVHDFSCLLCDPSLLRGMLGNSTE